MTGELDLRALLAELERAAPGWELAGSGLLRGARQALLELAERKPAA